MIFREVHQLAGQASAAAGLQLNLLHEKRCESPEETLRRKLEFADLSLVARELKHHLEGLRRILMVCKAVERGRYLEHWQQCDKCWGACTGCTSAEDCLVFDDREPHAVISAVLSYLPPLSDSARQWILRLGSYSRGLAEEAFGKETVRGFGSIAIDCGGCGNHADSPRRPGRSRG
jgi:hypothetical protein